MVEVLVEKHGAQVVEYGSSVTESLTSLRKQFPRHTCFVAQPDEVTKKFVAEVHQLTRKLDDDPYTDTFWGVITGYNATNALELHVTKSHSPLRRWHPVRKSLWNVAPRVSGTTNWSKTIRP